MRNLCYFFLAACFLYGCKKEDATQQQTMNFSITGVAQKGPFQQGSKVTVYELNEKLEQTGKVFKTETSDDFGSFEIKNMLLTSSLVQIEVEGNPFNEVSGGYVMGDDITLGNIVDLKRGTIVNVNILSDLARQRMITLVQGGTSFDSAKVKAERCVFAMIGLDSLYKSTSEKMNITIAGDENGSLLALSSIILKTKLNQHAIFLQSFISKIKTDLSVDGELSDPDMKTAIKMAIAELDLSAVNKNLSDYYKTSIPSFSKYIDIAKVNLSVFAVSNYKVSITSGTLNFAKDTCYVQDSSGSFNVVFPKDGYKKVRLTISMYNAINDLYVDFGYLSGWQKVNGNADGYIYELNAINVTEPVNIHVRNGRKNLVNITLDDLSVANSNSIHKWASFNNW